MFERFGRSRPGRVCWPACHRTLRRAAACFVLLGLSLSAAIPAAAQDVPGDLSLHERVNFWERSFAYGLVSGWAHRAHVPALSQPFTTRSNIAGYRLRGVRFNIDFNSTRINYGTQTIGNRTGPTEITVSICDDDNGLPGRDVVKMDLVGRAGDGVMEFRARQVQGADPILLPDTTYHVLFTRGIGGAGYRLGLVRPADAGSFSGGSFHNSSRSYVWHSLWNESLGPVSPSHGEYGDPGFAGSELLDFNHGGFDVTYGWNRMPMVVGLQMRGSTITGQTPLFNLPPRPDSATVPAAGHELTIVFDNPPADAAGQTPAADRFTVTANRQVVPISAIAVSGSDRRVTLTLSTTIKQDQVVRVSYADPTDGDDAAALQSPAGLDARSFSNFRVSNGSTVTDPAPRPVSATIPAAGTTVVIALNQEPDGRTGRTPAASAFTLTVDELSAAISAVAVSRSARRVTLTPSKTIKQFQRVTVGYTDPTDGNDTAALQAPTGEDAQSFSDYPVTNNSTVANPRPTLVSATVPAAGDKLDMVFTKVLDNRAGRTPAASLFTVTADGETLEVTGVEVSPLDKRVRLTLSPVAWVGQTVTVSYRDPTTNDDTAAIQLADGTDAASFSDRAVTNSSTVPHPDNRGPVVQSAQWTSNIRSTIVLTFTHRIDKSRLPPASWFTLTLAGSEIANDGVRGTGVSNRQMLIDVENALFSDTRTVTVTYNDPNDATNDGNAIQSVNGHDAADFTIDVSGVVGSRDAGDGRPALSVADATAVEGTDATADFVVTLEPPASETVTVRYATSDGTATEPDDYTSHSGTLTFAAGETSKTVSVPVVDDSDEDSGETFTLTLSKVSGGNARLADATATGTILNDERTLLQVTRSVSDDAAPGTAVGPPVVAGDPDGDTLTYALFGEDAAAFTIDADTGQIRTKAGVDYDYLTKSTYEVGVAASDTNGNAARIRVLILLLDSGALTARSTAAPATHDRTPFELQVEFSRPVVATPVSMGAHGLSVTNGEVVEAFRVGDAGTGWGFRILPWSNAAVTAVLPKTEDCAAAGALCTADGRMLSEGLEWEIAPENAAAVDTSAPELVSVGALAEHVTLLYGEALDESSVPGAGAFTVKVAGKTRALAESGAVAVSNRRVTLTLATKTRHGQAVTVSYAPPSDHPLQDLAGNAAPALGARKAINRTPRAAGRITVRIQERPETHDGSVFLFKAFFYDAKGSEPAPVVRTVREMREDVFAVSGGTMTGAWRTVGHDNWWGKAYWTLRIQPTSDGPVRVELPATVSCSDPGALCTLDGDRLTEGVEFEVAGPEPGEATPMVSVRDAFGDEGGHADFALRLSRTWTRAVTVEYATADSTATAGSDYTATSGTARFPPGERTATVSVPVLDDTETEGPETFTLTLAAPEDGEGEVALATATGTIKADPGGGSPVTAAFPPAYLPEGHDGSAAFTVEVEFGEEVVVDSAMLRDAAFDVTNGEVTAVRQTDWLRWEITVRPASDEDVTIALVPKSSCDAVGAICTASGRGLAETVEATVRGPSSTAVTAASVTSGPGDNGTWDAGETVEADLRFSVPVTVTGGPPTLAILLDGTRREAALTGGSGTDRLTFSHTVTAADDGARRARVAANGLSTNGATVVDGEGRKVGLRFPVAPWVTGVEVAADGSGDRIWTPGETIEVRLAFSEAVTVADGNPWLETAVAGSPLPVPLGFASGSGSATLVFSAQVPEGAGDLTGLAVVADSLTANGAAIVSAVSGLAADLRHDGTEPAAAPEPGALDPLTAEFLGLPDGHGGAAFTFELRFSEEFELSWRTLKDHALGVTGGTLTGIGRAVRGENQVWNLTVTPDDGAGDVTVVLAETTDCAAVGAVCTGDGRMLSPPVSVTVPEAAPAGAPFEVRLKDLPTEHTGSDEIVFKIEFTKEPADYSYVTLRDATLRIRRGETVLAPGVRRLNAPHNDRWEVKVAPGGTEDVTVSIGPFSACSDAGAVCTAQGEVLENEVSETVLGPPGLSVADARVHEAPEATVDFAVTLGRASRETVTVEYATADGSGSNAATAGEDYEARSGTLTFAPGDTAKTVSVPVLDDAHDEGEETFTLTLSNPQGGNAWLGDATAVGTIENSDAMPKAWLARFGRATAEQVVTHIEERMAAPRQQGFRARFAGREFQPGSERDFAFGLLSSFAPMGAGSAGRAAPGATGTVTGSRGSPRAGASGADTSGMGGALGMGGTTDLTGRHSQRGGAAGGGLFGALAPGGDLFSNSEFELNRESRGGLLSVWSRSSRAYFDGLEDGLSLNGDVRTAMVGADWARGPLTVGLSVGHTRGLGGYDGRSAGAMTTSMTGFYPWLGYRVNDRVSVWGVTGYGKGALSLTPEGASALETGMAMAMTAVGTRGELIGSRAAGGFGLAFRADALWVGAATDLLDGPTGRLNASEAGVTRVRTALEGSRGFTMGGRLSLTPTVEVGLRRDSGDAETGAGLDVGGGLAFTDKVTGLSLDVRVRTLVVHQAEGFRDRGMSVSLGWDPTPSSPLGLTAKVAPSWGGQAQGGAEALWGSQMAYGMGSHRTHGSSDRVDAEVGYGLPVGARFVGTPRVGLTTSLHGRDYRAGYAIGVLESENLNFELGVDAQRHVSPTRGEASNGFMGRATLSW